MNQLLSGYRMLRAQFFRVLVSALTTGMTSEAIRRGFKNTGIYPINRKADILKNTEIQVPVMSMINVSPYWTK